MHSINRFISELEDLRRTASIFTDTVRALEKMHGDPTKLQEHEMANKYGRMFGSKSSRSSSFSSFPELNRSRRVKHINFLHRSLCDSV